MNIASILMNIDPDEHCFDPDASILMNIVFCNNYNEYEQFLGSLTDASAEVE